MVMWLLRLRVPRVLAVAIVMLFQRSGAGWGGWCRQLLQWRAICPLPADIHNKLRLHLRRSALGELQSVKELARILASRRSHGQLRLVRSFDT